MKKIFFLLGLFIPAIIYAQNSYKVDFTTILGDATCYEEGYSVLQTDIGGYLVSAGYNCSNFYWNWQGWLISLDNAGNSTGSQKQIVGNGPIKKTNDHNFVNLKVDPNATSTGQIRATKFDITGSTVWTKQFFFGVCNNSGEDIIQASDSGYALTGFFSTVSCSSPVYDSYLVKLDASGNTKWSKTYGNPADNEEMYVVRETADKGFALFGWYEASSSSSRHYYLIKTDPSGNVVWSKMYQDKGKSSFGFGMDVTTDGGFILIGYSDSTFVIKTDGSGNVQWSKKYFPNGGGDMFEIIQTSDGGYAYIATEFYNNNVYSAWAKLDNQGNVTWETLSSGAGDYFYDIVETSDLGFIVTGSINYPPDVVAIKYSMSSIGIYNDLPGSRTVSIVPNPISSEGYIEIDGSLAGNYRLDFYSLTGQLVKSILTTEGKTKINRTDFTSGFYLLKVSSETGTFYSGKILFQ